MNEIKTACKCEKFIKNSIFFILFFWNAASLEPHTKLSSFLIFWFEIFFCTVSNYMHWRKLCWLGWDDGHHTRGLDFIEFNWISLASPPSPPPPGAMRRQHNQMNFNLLMMRLCSLPIEHQCPILSQSVLQSFFQLYSGAAFLRQPRLARPTAHHSRITGRIERAVTINWKLWYIQKEIWYYFHS